MNKDNKYVIGLKEGMLKFKSFNGDQILWIAEQSIWVMSKKENNITICLSDVALPAGLHIWKHCHINERGYYYSTNSTISLNLNACHKTEFGCNDGTCRPYLDRCNHVHDCDDGEDEENCTMINIPKGYNKASPVSKHTNPPVLKIKFELMNLFEMNLSKSTLCLKLYVYIFWKDERLR